MASNIDYLLTGNKKKRVNKKTMTAQTLTTSAPEDVSDRRRKLNNAEALRQNRRIITGQPVEDDYSRTIRISQNGIKDATKYGVAETSKDLAVLRKMGQISDKDPRLMSNEQLKKGIQEADENIEKQKQKKSEFEKLAEEEKAAKRDEAAKLRSQYVRLFKINESGLPYMTNYEGRIISPSDESWNSGDVDSTYYKRLTGRPEDYDDERYYSYDRLMYDNIYGAGAYDARLEELQDDEYDLFEQEIDDYWDALENGKLEDYVKERKELANQAELDATGDFGYDEYQKIKESFEEQLAANTDLEQWVAHNPTKGNQEYDPALDKGTTTHYNNTGLYGLIHGNIVEANGGDVDKIYHWANNLPTEDMSELDQYDSLQAAMFMPEDVRRAFNSYYSMGMYKEAMATYNAAKPYLNWALTTTKAMYEKDMSQNEYAGNMVTRRIILGPVAGASGVAATVAAALGDKKAQDPNSEWWALQNTNENITKSRAKVWGDIFTNVFGEDGRRYGELIGNALHSIGDEVMAMLLTAGVGGAAGKTMADAFSRGMLQFIMSSEATAGAMKERLDNNQDPTEAALYALGSGVVEAVTEKYSIDALFKMDFNGLLRDKQRILSYIGKNFLTEGTEEVAADVLNTAWDTAVSIMKGTKPEMVEQYEALLQEYDPATAEKMVKDQYKEKLLDSFLAGGFSGLLLSAGTAGINAGVEYAQNQEIGKNVREYNAPVNGTKEEMSRQETENIRRLITTAGRMQATSQSKQRADILQGKINAGEKISNNEIGSLVRDIVDESGEQVGSVVTDVLKNEVRKELEKNGASKGNAKKWSDFVTRTVLTSKAKMEDIMKTDAGQATRELMKDLLGKSGATAGMNEKTATQLAELATVMSLDLGIGPRTAADVMSHVSVRDTMLSFAKETDLSKIAADAATDIRENLNIQRDVVEIMSGDARKTAGNVAKVTGDAKVAAKADWMLLPGAQNRTAQSAVHDGKIIDIAGIKTEIETILDEETGKEKKQSIAYGVMPDGTKVDLAEVQAIELPMAKLLRYSQIKTNRQISDEAMSVLVQNADKIKDADSAIADAAKVAINTILERKTGDTRLGAELQGKVEAATLKAFEAEENKRIANRRDIKPGQGIAVFGSDKFGTEAFKKSIEEKVKDKRIREEAYFIAELAKNAGFDVELKYDPDDDGNYGNFSGKNGITINLAATRANGSHQNALSIFSHEVTHWLEANSPEAYKALRKFVVERLESQGVNVASRLQDIVNNWRMNGAEDVDLNGAVAEMVANGSDQILTNEKVVEELRGSDPSLFGKIKEAVKDLLERFRDAIARMSGSTTYESRNLTPFMDRLGELWLGAFREAKGTTGTATAETTQNAFRDIPIDEESINRNRTEISQMEPIKASENEMFKMGPDLKKNVKSYYAGMQNKVESDVFGTIQISNTKISDSFGHGMTPLKAAAYAFLPEVLKHGKVADYIELFEDENFDSAILAAPVEITNGQLKGEYYIGAVIKLLKDGSNRYYTHDGVVSVIKMSDGTTTTFDPASTSSATKKQEYTGKNKGGNHHTIESILELIPKRNGIYKNLQNSFREKELDRQYEEAVNRKDWRTAENMLLEKMQQTSGITGYRAPNFYNGEHANIAKMIKENYGDAVARAVEDMAPMVPENAVLIPMPPHEGKVLEDTDTMILAKALGEATGMPVVVALESDPHTSRNLAKKTGDRTVTADSMGFRQIADIPEGSMPVFVDNMVGGGTTATAAKNAIGRGITLAYAQSARAKSLGVKDVSVTYDSNGKLIPLSQRMDPTNKSYKYSMRENDEAYNREINDAEERKAQWKAVQHALDNPKKQFSMREPVEAKNNGMIAVHNLAEEQLIKTIRLGGFPMPSIAIVKDDYAHDRYGDISVIFYSDTIDPKKTKLNKVYSGDAWTPTYPYVEYKLSKKALDKVVKKVESLIPRNILQDLTFSSLDETNLTKSVNSARGDIVQAAKENKKLKLAYLLDTGKTIEYPMREKRISTRFTNEMVEKIAQTLGKKTAEEAYMGSSSWFDEHPEIVEMIRNVVAGIWEEEVKAKLGAEKSKLKIANMNPYSKENWGFSHNYSAIEGAWKYFNRGIEQELDEHALDEIINKEINEEKYEQWLRDQFAGIIEKSGIRNNKDFFTNYGTPRSWEALHDEETIENVVRIMKAEVDKGANALFGQSAMLALGTRNFKSLDDIRKHSGQLQHISEEEMSAAKTTIVNGFGELMDEMMDKSERNIFIARDRALEAMVDAVRTSKTPAGIMRVLKEYQSLNVPADAGERIVALLHEIENLPTEYFEAKPQRAVGLDEIASAIIPEQASNELVQLLKANNIPYKMYDGTNEDRLKKVNSVENVKFSFREEVDYNVKQWLDSININSLRSDVERMMVSDYRDLEIGIRLDMERERNIREQIRQMEQTPEEKRSKEDQKKLERLKIRLENVGQSKAAKQKKMAAITGKKGFGKLMQEQNRIFNDNVYGRTQAEVNEIVTGMEETARRIQERVEAAKAEAKELEKNDIIQKVKKILGATTADMAVDELKRRFHSNWTKRELRTFFDPILVKMNAGEEFDNEVQELADVLVRSNQELVYEGLSALQGLTITIGRGQKQELKGTNSSLNEIRDRLAGTGIKVRYGKYSSLEGDVEDIRAEFPGMPELGDEKDSLENFVSWVEGMKNQFGIDEYYSDYLAEAMAAVMETAARTASDSGLYVPKDAKARKQITDLVDYIRSLKTRTETAEKSLASISDLMREIREAGERATGMSTVISNNMQDALKYYDTIAKLAMEEAKRNKTSAIIDQLKSKQAEKILKINEEWRELLQRSEDAHKQAEDNRAERSKINTAVKRMYHLLKDQTTAKNMPEYMKPLARYVIRQFVENDALGEGRKLTKADKNQLAEAMRLLRAWDEQDGPAEYNQIIEGLREAEEAVELFVTNDLTEIAEGLAQYNSEIRGKNKLDTLQQRGEILKRISAAVGEIYDVVQAERETLAAGRKVKTESQAAKVRQGTGGIKFRERTGKIGRAAAAMHKAIVSGNMTPEYFFRTIGNEGLNDLWENYHQAENRNGLELAKAKKRLKEIADKHGYGSWDMQEKVTVKLGGKNIEMTLGQLMSLYATWKREQQLGPAMSEHLTTGGFFVEKDLRDGILGKEVMEKRAHRISSEGDVTDDGQLPAVENALTKEQKDFVDDVVSYMSNEMSELGNEASMIAYGIKLYKEKYYFPFQIWDGVKSRKSNDAGQGANVDRAFHPSFAKSRLHGANNALILGDFMQTAADHIAGMINYATMGLANESLQKVLNYQLEEGGETPDGYDIYDVTKRNIRAVLEEAYGQEAKQYLANLQMQLNGGAVKVEKSFYDKLISLFRKNAVAGSLSVAAQQPLSYIRAAVLIDSKYLAAALNPKYWKNSYKEMLEHSGVAVIKDMGRFDMNFGQSAREYLQPEGKETKLQKAWGQVTEKATILPELADRATWTRMWSAVKLEQHAEHPEMDIRSDEFLDLCGKRFNEVMRRTQVYDSVLVKSANMRNQNTGMKMLTSFMAEPTLSLNVLADAVRSARAGEAGWKALLAKAGTTFLMSAVLQAAVKALLSAGRTPDDKKTQFENWMYRFGSNVINEVDPLQLLPMYNEVLSAFKNGKINDDAMGTLGKLFTAGKDTVSLLLGNGWENPWKAVEDSVGQVAQLMTDLPVKNIMRDLRASYNLLTGGPYAKRENNANVIDKQFWESFFNADNAIGLLNEKLGDAGYKATNTAYYRRIYEAQKAGDEEKAQSIIDYLIYGKGVKEKTIKTGVNKAKKEAEAGAEEEE